MKNISRWLLLIVGVCSVGLSCKKAKDIEYQKNWPLVNEYIYRLMKDVYFYEDKMPTKTDMSKYESPSEALDALTYKTLDVWSYVENVKTMEDFYQNNVAVAYGFNLIRDENKNIYICNIAKNSPAQIAGLTRGCKLNSINGFTINEIKSFADIYPSSAGETISLNVTYVNGTSGTVQLTAGQISTETVPLYKVITAADNTKFGYILINNFVQSTPSKIDEAFASFASVGVSNLIVDLRYNGGGMVDAAEYLANMVIPASCNKKKMFDFIYNPANTKYNQSIPFNKTNTLSFNRVFILTTGNTASASELFLNVLKPYIEVIQIGETSYGKPVGMNTFTYGDYAIVPITFATVNANNEGYYYGGIDPTIPVNEDFSKPLGDASEPFIAAALNYPSSLVAVKNYVIPLHDHSLDGKGLHQFINFY
jgi:carboxyl-terminal processing protease